MDTRQKEIYAVSDLHGQYELFRRLLQKINFNHNDYMYVLGDVIDRGPKSVQLLQSIMSTPNMELLIGNHEFMMLKALNPDGTVNNIEDFLLWANYNGGQTTYDQLIRIPQQEITEIYSYLIKRKLTTKVEVSGNTYYLTHAYPDLRYIDSAIEDVPLNDIWNSVWKSPYREGSTGACFSEYPQDGITIMGHVPVSSQHHKSLTPLENKATIDIDGGCVSCGDYEADCTGVMIYNITSGEICSYSFEDFIGDMLDENASDEAFIEALGIYTAAPILNMRAKYAKYIN